MTEHSVRPPDEGAPTSASPVALFSGRAGQYLLIGLAVALVVASLFLPPVSLGNRLFHWDVPLVRADEGGSVAHLSGTSLQIAPGTMQGDARILIEAYDASGTDGVVSADSIMQVAQNTVLMPSYVNIGAYVGEGTMVDTWATVDDSTLAILDSCQHLVLVTTPQVMALRDTRRFLDAMRLLNYDLDRMLLVLNQCYHRVDVKMQDVERALGLPVAQIVEYAPGPVTSSLNRGVPLVTEYRSSLAAQNIVRLAGLLAQRSAQEALGAGEQLATSSNGSKGRGLRARKKAG